MAENNEPRALSAALSGPAMTTRAGGLAMHVADRHVERWAPEATASKSRPLRNLSFVDKTIAPWIETAQRSASLRLFSQYRADGAQERQPANVSWVFPRPWYQDELDWMAAAREAQARPQQQPMLTTRGTYVQPQAPAALPAALYEFVAPSLSIAQPTTEARGIGYGGNEAYSPLVPLAAVQAAEVMQRAVAPAMLSPTARPAIRNVLSTMLARAAMPGPTEIEPSRVSLQAPELVTPPAPRPDQRAVASEQAQPSEAIQLAERYAEQRAQIAEVQRVARVAAEREMAARIEAARAQVAAQTTASATAAAPGVREATVRAEAELRARTQQDAATSVAAKQEAAVAAAKQEAERTEKARIEERIAQRLAERTATTRMHEQARAEAAAHARAEVAAPVAPAAALGIEQPRAPQQSAPAEVAAAIAALPPELQTFISQGKGGAMRAIDELGEALRTVELLSRAAASGTAFESSRGPRLMMPAGIGGLVATLERAQPAPQIAPLRFAQAMPTVGAPSPVALPPAARAAASAMRVPTMQFVTGAGAAPARAAQGAPTSAFEAATAAKPAALSHVAWADRWLARFAGASQQSLDTFGAASSFDRAARIQALSSAAPDSVFVAPTFDVERSGDVVRFEASGHPVVTSRSAAAPTAAPTPMPLTSSGVSPRLIEQPQQDVVRIADDAETPDEVFAAIAAGATRARAEQRAPQQAASLATSETAPVMRAVDRPTVADAVAHATPSAPGAGFAAQLASSPFAPALRHVLPLPSAQSFDVRSLFGGGLSATYLAGLLASTPDEIATSISKWAAWQQPSSADASAESFGTDAPGREFPAFDATYVAPDALDPEQQEARAAAAATPEALTTMRSALLSWNVGQTPSGTTVFAPSAQVAAPIVSQTSTSPIAAPTARSMMETLSLPMMNESVEREEEQGAAWTAPGMLADRAHAFSIAQERSSADLSFDFVPPELVLAARVYGLGPVEAAQAARLAVAGPGHLTAMAGAVDRTFVQAMTMEAARREAIATAYPSGTGDVVTATRSTSEDVSTAAPQAPTSTGTSFGVDRKAPRGAFLWPSATVAALGLNAAAPDGHTSMSVAALELLAAQAVAEIGTYTALSEAEVATDGDASRTTREVAGREAATVIARGDSRDATQTSEPAEADVLASASALVPSSRRGRFDALYIALSQSPSSASWSPAARAARALALAGQGEDGARSARERAAFAWDVLPVVYADSIASFGAERAAAAFSEPQATGSIASDGRTPTERRAAGGGIDRRTIGGREYVAAEDMHVDGRPGLAGLSARAGEALGSYVAPAAPASSTSSSSSSTSAPREVGAVLRAPTATQELVRTGSGRHGGGETEIPAWFEKAARKMLEDRSAPSDGISMAELTLVTAAPAAQIAASTRTAPSANPITSGTNSQASPAQAGAADIDVEKIANDIYRHILVMMDVARARNGEPYL